MVQGMLTVELLGLASVALASLLLLWLVSTRREILRVQRDKILRLAAHLRSDILDDLSELDSRNRALRVHVAKVVGPNGQNASRHRITSDLVDDLHTKAISDLRGRTERTYREIQARKGQRFEDQCRTLEAIAQEVQILKREIEDRSVAWSATVRSVPESKKPRPKLALAA